MTPRIGLTLLLGAALAAARWDPAEQAQRGRTAWRGAVTALRAGDSTGALAQLRTAHEAWPAQPTYSEALVRIAARLHDAATVTRTLRLLAAQGLGHSVISDPALRGLAATDSAVAHAVEAVARSGGSLLSATAQVVLGDTLFFPEGLAADARDGTLFITSLRHRNVWVRSASGAGHWLLPSRTAARSAVFGAKVSSDGRSLWLTLAPSPHMRPLAADSALRAELWQVDRASGAVLTRAVLGDGKGVPGELALHDDGSVLVSDATLGKIYRWRPNANAVSVVESPLLRSPQGIALLPGGQGAIVADWSHGLLYWDLSRDEIRAIETPGTMALLGIDGLLWVDGALVAVQNGVQPMRVLRIVLESGAQRVASVDVLDRPSENAGEFTVAAAIGREIVFVSSSSWPFWNDDGERLSNAGAIPPVTLRRFQLPAATGSRP